MSLSSILMFMNSLHISQFMFGGYGQALSDFCLIWAGFQSNRIKIPGPIWQPFAPQLERFPSEIISVFSCISSNTASLQLLLQKKAP